MAERSMRQHRRVRYHQDEEDIEIEDANMQKIEYIEDSNSSVSDSFYENPVIELVDFTKAKSPYWKYFSRSAVNGRVDPRLGAVCKLCGSRVNNGNNTTNLRHHLSTWHSETLDTINETTSVSMSMSPGIAGTSSRQSQSYYPDTNQSPNQPANYTFATERVSTSSPRSSIGSPPPSATLGMLVSAKAKFTRPDRISELVIMYLVRNLLPVATVENKDFRALLAEMNPKYQLPSRTFFTDVKIPEMYRCMRSTIQQGIKVQQLNKFCITLEFWRKINSNLMSVMMHYIDPSWNAHTRSLHTQRIPDPSYSAHIATELRSIYSQYGLPTTVQALAHGEMDRAAFEKAGCKPVLTCFAHALQKSVSESMSSQEIVEIVTEIRRRVSYLKCCQMAQTVLQDNMDAANMGVDELMLDEPSQWWSTYDMMARFIKHHEAIATTLEDYRVADFTKTHPHHLGALSPEQVNLATEVVLVLRSVRDASLSVMEESDPTIACIIPIRHSINIAVQEVDSKDFVIITMKNTLLDQLKTIYSDAQDTLLLATFLDPRFLQMRLVSTVESQRCVKLAVEAMDEYNNEPEIIGTAKKIKLECDSVDVVSSSVPTKTGLSRMLMGTVSETPKFTGSRANSEVLRYSAEELYPLNENPLLWWRNHELTYPLLANVAKLILCIPATALPPKRLFSHDALAVYRPMIEDKDLNSLIFLHHNI